MWGIHWPKQQPNGPLWAESDGDSYMRKLNNWIEAYLAFTENTEAPQRYHQWAAISTLAGAMNRKCWVNIGRFPIYPSLYVVFVAPPGIATKSTTAKQGMDLLETSKTVTIYDGALTYVGLFDELCDSERIVQFDKVTQQMCCLQVFASELGTLLNNGEVMIDHLVDIWDGKPSLKYRTRGSGKLDIPRPYINLLACTTPSWLKKNAGMYAIDGGFFSRTIFVYAEKKDKLIAYPISRAEMELKDVLCEDLKVIGELRGEFTLSDEATAYGESWYEMTHTNPPECIASDLFGGYRSRRQAHLHKVAMAVAASKKDCDMIIRMEDLIEAEVYLEEYEKDLRMIYEGIMQNERTMAYKVVKDFLIGLKRRNLSMTKSNIFRELASQLPWQDFELAIQALQFAGEIGFKQKGNDVFIYCKEGE